MSEKKANHQANIVKITEILPHNNADNLVIIPIGQYQVVARKGDFKIGSLGVYIQPDSVVPQTEPFRFIWEPYVIDGDETIPVLERHRRITVRKFRGEWSEGLLLPVRDFPELDKYTREIKALPAEKDAEIERLTGCLKRTNDGFEEYERKFYLENDKVESLKAELALWRSEHDPCPFSIELESLKARAEQWEKVAGEYRTHREHQFCKIRVAGLMHGSTIDDRCDQCKAYDSLSEPREGEQDATVPKTVSSACGVRDVVTPDFTQGDDVSDLLGITHYDPDAGKEGGESIDLAPRKRRKYPKTIKGWFKFILYRFIPRARRKSEFIDLSDKIDIPSYDVESFKNYPNVFNEGELVIVTEKIHGSNARYVCIDDVMYIGSHYKWRSLHANDAFTKALAANPWIEEWCRVHQGYVLYGEVTPTQGGFNYGTEKPQFFLFDIRDPNGKWVPVNEYSSLGITCTEGPEGQCTDYPEHLVPVLYIGPYVKEYILSLVDGPSLAAKGAHVHEGIVIKTVEERYARGIGRAQVKLVSNTFLDKDSKLK